MRKSAVVTDIHIHLMQPMEATSKWNIIRLAFSEGLGGFALKDSMAMTNILADIQAGKIQCWAGFTRAEGKIVLMGMLFTTVTDDPRTGAVRLSIIASRAYKAIHSDVYKKVLERIEEFGRENGCDTIEMMVTHPRVQKMLDRVGFPPPAAYYIKEL